MTDKSPGSYEMMPLRSDEIKVGIIQSRVKAIDAKDPEKGKWENLDHMFRLIDIAQSMDTKDLLAFHEFPIGGFDMNWQREQVLNMAIDIPGKETEAIGKKAKEYNCYIHFGCYAKLPDWPGHFMNMGVIVGPNGDVIHKHWKTRNLSGFGFSTTVYDVLDEYVKRYGWDAVFPIAQTDIGNLGIIPEILEPELGRAYAMKGAEIMIRYMTSGASTWRIKPLALIGGNAHHTFRVDLQAQCMAGHFYGLFVNDAISTEGEALDQGMGYSAIMDCDGKIMIEASSSMETMISAAIPMATYRKNHAIPQFPKDLYMHLYNEYTPRIAPNTFLESMPNSMMDGIRHYQEKARW